MSDPRPRPQFGEYATPEQQRAARGLPEEPVAPPAPVVPEVSDAASAPVKANRFDRFVTFALLVYGLITVFTSGSSYLDVAPLMNQAMGMVGIDGEFTNFAAGRTWGLIAALVLATGWTLTAVLSVRRLRTGKLTWWVPVVGGVATTFLASICLVVPMMGDPAFLGYIQQSAGL